jgi:hypothetical protein
MRRERKGTTGEESEGGEEEATGEESEGGKKQQARKARGAGAPTRSLSLRKLRGQKEAAAAVAVVTVAVAAVAVAAAAACVVCVEPCKAAGARATGDLLRSPLTLAALPQPLPPSAPIPGPSALDHLTSTPSSRTPHPSHPRANSRARSPVSTHTRFNPTSHTSRPTPRAVHTRPIDHQYPNGAQPARRVRGAAASPSRELCQGEFSQRFAAMRVVHRSHWSSQHRDRLP